MCLNSVRVHDDSIKRVRRLIALSGGNNVFIFNVSYSGLSNSLLYMFVIVYFRHSLYK